MICKSVDLVEFMNFSLDFIFLLKCLQIKTHDLVQSTENIYLCCFVKILIYLFLF